MIVVTIYNNGYSVVGHADYARHGSDIVCAGVSALTQASMLGLQAYCHIKADVKSGEMYIYLNAISKKTAIIIGTMLLGLREIEKQFPNHLKVNEEWSVEHV